MKARELMTSDPHVVTRRDSIARAAEIMRDLDIGLVPVVEDPVSMHLVGVITDRDIAVRCVAKKHGISCTVADHMTPAPLATAEPDDDVDAVIATMERSQVRRIPIVDGDNRLVGIIAQADLATKLGPKEPKKLEEVLERISAPRPTPATV
jgi:CBS domain-containing protein